MKLEVRMVNFDLELKKNGKGRVTVYVDVQKEDGPIDKYWHTDTFNHEDKSDMGFKIGRTMQYCLDKIT